MLLRATTHMSLYERALEERGIPTHVVGGRGYWSQQQVGDLRNWLAALANPRDELSLLSVLASPLVGVSLDGVALLALRADKAGPRPVVGAPGPARGALRRHARRRRAAAARASPGMFAEERAAAPRVSLERLIDRAVTRTGYDQHVLARPAGDRRMANVRKLMRMAREFEAEEGRDLRRFIDFVAERDLIQSREGEAPLEAEELQRVRLMTIHRAKGLEFPVVFVADLGKEGREENGPLQISRDGRVGLRLASLGADAVRSETLEAVKAQQNEDDEAEERRIMYVALTRAREHLVLSGATDLEKRKEPEALTEPLRWMWRNLVPELPSDDARGVGVESYEGRDVRGALGAPGSRARSTSCCRPADRVPTRPEPEPERTAETPSLELGMMAAPRALPVARLSYSSLESYRRCGYRFYLERALRLPGSDTAVPDAEPVDALPALLRGNLVHQLLERLDMRRGPLPTKRDVEAPDRAARPAGARGRRRRPARHGRALLGLRAAGPPGRGAAGAGGAAVLLHARARPHGRPQPARQRVRGRVRARGRPHADRRLQERPPGARTPPPRRSPSATTRPSGWSTRWPRCARAPPEWRSCTSSSSAPASRPR